MGDLLGALGDKSAMSRNALFLGVMRILKKRARPGQTLIAQNAYHAIPFPVGLLGVQPPF